MTTSAMARNAVKLAEEPADHGQVQNLRDRGEGDEKDGQAGQDLRAAGSAKIEIAVVDRHRQESDLDRGVPVVLEKL